MPNIDFLMNSKEQVMTQHVLLIAPRCLGSSLFLNLNTKLHGTAGAFGSHELSQCVTSADVTYRP